MKKDIENRNDIELLVNTFYDRVKVNDCIGYIFNDVAKVDWPKHLPVMYDFWENTLFFTGVYRGNAMLPHIRLHSVSPLTAEHFQCWLQLFVSTVEDLFEGEKAELAKQRAMSISTMMHLKVLHQNNKNI